MKQFYVALLLLAPSSLFAMQAEQKEISTEETRFSELKQKIRAGYQSLGDIGAVSALATYYQKPVEVPENIKALLEKGEITQQEAEMYIIRNVTHTYDHTAIQRFVNIIKPTVYEDAQNIIDHPEDAAVQKIQDTLALLAAIYETDRDMRALGYQSKLKVLNKIKCALK